MKRVPLTFGMAYEICMHADFEQYEEWNSMLEFASHAGRAREMTDHSLFKWGILEGKHPVAAFGCFRTTNTTLTGWCMTVDGAPKKVWVFMLKEMKRAAKGIFKLGVARRIHAFCCTNRPGPVYYASKGGMEVLADLKNYGSHKDFKLMAITPEKLS